VFRKADARALYRLASRFGLVFVASNTTGEAADDEQEKTSDPEV